MTVTMIWSTPTPCFTWANTNGPLPRIFCVALHCLQIRAHARSEIRLVADAFGRFMEDLCGLCHAGLIFFTTFFAKTKGNDATSNI